MSKSSRRGSSPAPPVAVRDRRPELTTAGLVSVSATLLSVPGVLLFTVLAVIMFATATDWTADSPLPLLTALTWLGELFLSAFGLVAGWADSVRTGERVSRLCARICGGICLGLIGAFVVALSRVLLNG